MCDVGEGKCGFNYQCVHSGDSLYLSVPGGAWQGHKGVLCWEGDDCELVPVCPGKFIPSSGHQYIISEQALRGDTCKSPAVVPGTEETVRNAGDEGGGEEGDSEGTKDVM